MPAFCVRPNRSPLGFSRSISFGERQTARRPGTARLNLVDFPHAGIQNAIVGFHGGNLAMPATVGHGFSEFFTAGNLELRIRDAFACSGAAGGCNSPGPSVSLRTMKLCRFKNPVHEARVGALADDSTVLDLTAAGVADMTSLLESADPLAALAEIVRSGPPRVDLSDITLLAPVERQEVWAAGVTYLRSKAARMEESDFSASAYDRVYSAERPEIFFKSLPEKVVAHRRPGRHPARFEVERARTRTGAGAELARQRSSATRSATT